MPVIQKEASLELIHPKGSSAEILLYGATITSWKCRSQSESSAESPLERLFVSGKASLDGSKPVRGGVPIVFPIFGPPTKTEHMRLAQHGFARSERWSLDTIVLDDEAGVSVRLVLSPSAAVQEKYPFPCKLNYIVTLAEHQLTSHLKVDNTGTSVMEFQALLHTYHRVPANLVGVTPLQGLTYLDKTKSGTPKETENRDAVDVQEFTDFVYENARTASSGRYALSWGGSEKVEVRCTGFDDLVVWNPGKENGAKMGDMESGGWERFVCVEPGIVSSFVILIPGASWSGQQVMTIL